MLADLILRSDFPTEPGPDLAERFRAHVRDTGEPETFPGISTTRPPKDGRVVPLAINVSIPGKRRSRGRMAPCPICSPRTPKYQARGSLIWCEETQAIYAIGPDCYATLWTDGRLDREINRLRRTLKEGEDLEELKRAVEAAPAQAAWIKDHFKAAERADRVHADLAGSAPRFRTAIARATKANFYAQQQIEGHGFCRGTWKLAAKLQDAEVVWIRLSNDQVASAYPAGELALAPSAVSARLREVHEASAKMRLVADKLSEAAAFLAPANVQRMARWGNTDDAPIRYEASHTGSRVRVRCGEEVWEGPVGFAPAAPIPGKD